MDILANQIITCAVLGLLTGLIMALLLSEKKNILFIVLSGIIGLTTGIWFSLLWIFITGGLSLNIIMILTVVSTTIIIQIFILPYIKNTLKQFIKTKKHSKNIFIVMFLSIITLILIFSNISTSYISKPESTIFTGKLIYKNEGVFTLPEETITALTSNENNLPLSINLEKASLNFPFFTSSNPTAGQYLNFQITFNVGTSGGEWLKPYIKIAVVKDIDNSGTVTSNDEIWLNHNIKVATTSSKWRSNVYYNNNQPVQQDVMFTTMLYPIFHANTISVWKDDTGKKFPGNTPQGYTPQHDQLSWDLQGEGTVLMEDITNWAVVNKGSSTTISGVLYCHGSTVGQNILWVGAYDMNFQTDPWADSTPISSKTYVFSVQDAGIYVNPGGPYSGDVGETIKFSAGASGGTQPYVKWVWQFSDGTTKTGSPTYKSFSAPGSYTATATVTDSAGGTGTGTASVTIAGESPPVMPDIGIDISTYVTGTSLLFACLGLFTYSKRFF